MTGKQLSRAVALIEAVCAESGVTPEVEARSYVEPGDDEGREFALLTVRLSSSIADEDYIDLIPRVGERLARAGLLAPNLPLMLTFRP